ncbi:hypothetical protein AMTRI_Chr03g55090 [Amborella trichopoda]
MTWPTYFSPAWPFFPLTVFHFPSLNVIFPTWLDPDSPGPLWPGPGWAQAGFIGTQTGLGPRPLLCQTIYHDPPTWWRSQ